MKKRIIFLFILIIMLSGCSIQNEKGYSDSDKFKKEYEKLNGKVISSGKDYLTITISKNNIIKYSSIKEVNKLIKNGTGIIYLGFPECPWCRNMIPVLLEAADNTSLEKIYYVNMYNKRDTIEYINDSITTTKKASKEYYELVKLLEDILPDYTIKDSNDNTINTGTKRVYVPLVIFVKDGTVIGYHANTVNSQTDPYVQLTTKEQEELYSIYEKNIHNVLGDLCSEEGC